MARRRRYTLRPLLGSALFALLGSALPSCADLPVIDENRCGNGFIEKGEDCDALSGPAAKVCIAPGQVNQCHWQCTTTADCQTDTVSSRFSGWRCGVDGVCRQPEGEFVETGTLAPGNASELLTGDFNGDGRADVLAVTLGGFDIHYFDDQLALAKSLQVPAAPAIPAVGKLTGDLIPDPGAMDPRAKLDVTDDFTFNVGPGLSVMRGTTDQTVDPTSYLTFDISATLDKMMGVPKPKDIRILPVRLASGGGTTEFVYVSLPGIAVIVSSLDPTTTGLVFNIDTDKAIVGDIPTARLKASGACDNFALAYEGDSMISVYSPCPGNENISTVTLPSGLSSPSKPNLIAGRAFLVDVNADGNTDVLVGTLCQDGSCAELDVAYGDGNGGFFDGPDFNTAAPQQASTYLRFSPDLATVKERIGALPLAVGKLNNDGGLDYVDATSVRVSKGGYSPGATASDAFNIVETANGSDWTEAWIGDLNGNSRPDVVAATRDAAGIDFFNGTGSGVFNRFLVPTNGVVEHLTIGDFDGDLLGDIAYDDIVPLGKDNLRHTLSVAFGRPSGAPDLPVKMGVVKDLLQIASCNVAEFAVDATTDLAILAGNPGDPAARWRAGLSQGNAYRQLQVPLVSFSGGNVLVDSRPVASAIGAFDAASSHAGIAVVSDNPVAGNGDSLPASLWWLPAAGDAAVESPKASRNVELPAYFVSSPLFTNLTPIDLDSSGHASLLVAGAAADCSDPNACVAAGALLVTHLDSKAGKFAALDDVHPLEDRWFHLLLRTGDINNDQKQDVVSIQIHLDATYTYFDVWRAVVLLNDGNGKLMLPVQIYPPAGVNAEDAGAPIDLALVNVDGLEDKEIALLVRTDGSTRTEVHLLDWTPKGAIPVTDLHPPKDGHYDRHLSFDAARAIAGGDFDGDGVDDLAIAEAGGVRLLKGVVK
jgi:hypothetical protein